MSKYCPTNLNLTPNPWSWVAEAFVHVYSKIQLIVWWIWCVCRNFAMSVNMDGAHTPSPWESDQLRIYLTRPMSCVGQSMFQSWDLFPGVFFNKDLSSPHWLDAFPRPCNPGASHPCRKPLWPSTATRCSSVGQWVGGCVGGWVKSNGVQRPTLCNWTPDQPESDWCVIFDQSPTDPLTRAVFVV